MLTKTQLKEVFGRYDFRPLKRFGENYLIDGNIKDKIIAAAGIKKSDDILEIGPGLGALTFDLASSGALVYTVEKDKKAFHILKDLVKDDFPNLKLFNADILEFDLNCAAKDKKIKIIGNLPYYITTPIMEYIIENKSRVDSALVVVQKEVANRFLASPGSKDCGSISCFLQYFTKLSYIFTINRSSFFPEPDVDSALIRLDVLEKPSVKVNDEKLFFKLIRGSFNQRRKSIINSLSREVVLGIPKKELACILSKAGVEATARPEDLPLSAFAAISNLIP